MVIFVSSNPAGFGANFDWFQGFLLFNTAHILL